MHLDLDDSISAAGLTSSALHIETETSLLISPGLGICCRCKKITDLVKYSCVSSRVGTGSSSNRRLVNIDHLVQLVNSQDIIMLTGDHSCPVQISCKSLIQNLIDQRTLTGTGNTCDAGHHSQRNIHINMLQIIL